MNITTLKPNQVFVFGSNTAGRHGAGAALQAKAYFWTVNGIGEGPTGRCYAIPTLDRGLHKRTDAELSESIRRFLLHATWFPGVEFLLTKVGCGLAGYTEDYIRAKFVVVPSNVILPDDWK